MGLKTKNLDIVYCVKESDENEELRYSLRSLKNIPHRKVWIYGGCPGWVKGVKHVPMIQDKGNKWNNTSFMLREICKNDEITEDFIWFNDDFYVAKPITELDYYYDRHLSDRVKDFIKRDVWARRSKYSIRLSNAERALRMRHQSTWNYELHVPIIFNRKKVLALDEMGYEGLGVTRSIYCNVYKVGGLPIQDVKCWRIAHRPQQNAEFISTSDYSFKKGAAGMIIEGMFPRRCKYERKEKKDD